MFVTGFGGVLCMFVVHLCPETECVCCAWLWRGDAVHTCRLATGLTGDVLCTLWSLSLWTCPMADGRCACLVSVCNASRSYWTLSVVFITIDSGFIEEYIITLCLSLEAVLACSDETHVRI